MTKTKPKKHNYKLTDTDRKEIVLSHYLDSSEAHNQELRKKYDLSIQGFYNVINSEKAKQIITEYQSNLSKKFENIIEKAIKKLEIKVENEDIKALELTKIIGILYDKSRLEQNLSTENKAIQINIKVEK